MKGGKPGKSSFTLRWTPQTFWGFLLGLWSDPVTFVGPDDLMNLQFIEFLSPWTPPLNNRKKPFERPIRDWYACSNDIKPSVLLTQLIIGSCIVKHNTFFYSARFWPRFECIFWSQLPNIMRRSDRRRCDVGKMVLEFLREAPYQHVHIFDYILSIYSVYKYWVY